MDRSELIRKLEDIELALPKNIDIILKEDFTMPRNPIIAKTFRFVKLAEDMGTGFHKMINGWSGFYHIEPEITGDLDYYKITFPAGRKTEKVGERVGGKVGEVGRTVGGSEEAPRCLVKRPRGQDGIIYDLADFPLDKPCVLCILIDFR